MDAEIALDLGEGSRRRVRLRGEDDEPLATLWSQLSTTGVKPGDLLYADDVPIDPQGTWGTAGLMDGTVIAAGRATAPARIPAPHGRELRLVGGPGAGWRYPLSQGRQVLGRDPSADLVIPDPDCSRQHAALTVSRDGIVVEDLESTNGTIAEGVPVSKGAPQTVRPGDRIQVGSTLLEVTESSPEVLPLTRLDGHLGFNRRFRGADPTFPAKVDIPTEPRRQDPPPLNLLLTLLPAVAIAVVALAAGKPEFLLFAVLSPVVGVGRSISQRRQHTKRFQAELAKYEHDKSTMDLRLADAIRAERDVRNALAPDLAEVLVHARLPGRRLWDRQSNESDFLTVRVGAADAPTTVEATGEKDRTPRTIWRSPVTVSLRAIENLSVVGPRGRGRGVAASLVAQLASRESPSNLRLVLITHDDDALAWDWVTWLPHCRWAADDHFRLLGADGPTRAARLKELSGLIRARQSRVQQHREQQHLPAVVVILDDTSQALTEGFGEVLKDGPAVGVHAICMDELQVPSQCYGSITVPKGRLDDGVVDQRGQSPVVKVLVDQPEPVLLEDLGRALAPLKPLGEAVERDLPRDLRLVDLSDCPELSTDEVIRRWGASSPSPAAVMGLGIDGPVSLDLTEHGPHALVAGTTRAGKSEFIKTFVAALALVNHPDDLSFLFVDFKGGADYRILERLPHAVNLSTSEDLGDFERATRLLDAEINRRRKHFDRAETNTIEGYGAARRDDPSLEPIGRLVVIADEFAKLVREAPKALDRFVGVAQTGAAFGVHLVLATQRPAGAVTGQIDANVALRICFRVASVDDSSQVIDAPDAARIAQRDRGRAYFRAHNEALVEFQCARVGGPRKGSAEARVDARAEIVLWHEVGRVPPLPKRRELPDRSTDLWDVVEACRGAATQLGWRGSSVPWPKPLPERVTIEQLPAIDDDAIVPFAVADDAHEQCHRAIGLPLHRGHVAVVGSPGSGRTTTLLSAACSAAQHLSAADVHLHVLDFAGGRLRPLVDLPHCGGTAFDDWEQASRLVRDLTTEVTSRLELFARRGFPSIVEQRTSGDAPLPFLLLVIDGWEAIAGERMRLSLPDEITALLTRGLSAGVRVVLAGDRVVATDKVGRAISDKLILRFNEESDYTAFGLSMRDVPESQPPGRAIVLTTREIAQVAVVGDDVTQAIKELAAHVRERDEAVSDRWPQRLEPLPREITLAELTARRPLPPGDRVVPVGLGADRNEPRYVDLADLAGGFVIGGPPRSGRTTALRAIATFLSDRGTSIALVTPKASALSELADLPGVVAAISGADARRLDLATLAEASVVLIDDAELLDDSHDAHADLVAGDQSVVVAGDIGVLADAGRGWLSAAKKAKAGIILSPRARQDGLVLGTRLPDELVFSGPPGRAVVGIGGVVEVVQVPLA